MDSNRPISEAPGEADGQEKAADSPKDQLVKAVVQGILDGAELPLDEVPSFIEEVTNALDLLRQQVAERAETEMRRIEAVRAKIRGVEPRPIPQEDADLSSGSVWEGTLQKAREIVEHMEEDNLQGIRRKDVVAALRMTDVHASQALAYAVKEGWLKLEGQTRGAKYFLTGTYKG